MIRKLMQSIREFKLFSLLSPLFVVLEVVMEVVIPILMAKLIDDGIFTAEQFKNTALTAAAAWTR